MKSVKHLWASLLIVMAFVIICPTALAATGNSSQIHSKNPVDAYPNSTVGVIHFYIDDGKLIVYDPDERTSVRGDTGTATIYWTIPGQVFWSISSNISGPMVFSGSVSTTAGDYCPLNGISFDGYVSGLVDVQMMPGSNYATLEGSMLDIQGVSYVLPGVEGNRQISRRIKKHLWLSNRSWARDVHSFGILHSWGALAGKSCSAQASSIWLIAGAFRRTQSK